MACDAFKVTDRSVMFCSTCKAIFDYAESNCATSYVDERASRKEMSSFCGIGQQGLGACGSNNNTASHVYCSQCSLGDAPKAFSPPRVGCGHVNGGFGKSGSVWVRGDPTSIGVFQGNVEACEQECRKRSMCQGFVRSSTLLSDEVGVCLFYNDFASKFSTDSDYVFDNAFNTWSLSQTLRHDVTVASFGAFQCKSNLVWAEGISSTISLSKYNDCKIQCKRTRHCNIFIFEKKKLECSLLTSCGNLEYMPGFDFGRIDPILHGPTTRFAGTGQGDATEIATWYAGEYESSGMFCSLNDMDPGVSPVNMNCPQGVCTPMSLRTLVTLMRTMCSFLVLLLFYWSLKTKD